MAKTTKFLSVDVWRPTFMPVAQRAVYKIYSKTFEVEPQAMEDISFRDCVNALRKLENPDYKPTNLS